MRINRLINKTSIREISELSFSQNVYETIEKNVRNMILQAEEKAKKNHRKRIFAHDIPMIRGKA